MLASLIALSLFQVPPPKNQPGLMDPGLHGGRMFSQTPENGLFEAYDDSADITPDGRILISFRQQKYEAVFQGTGPHHRWALIAALVDEDRIQAEDDADLGAFYEAVEEPEPGYFGDEFAFSKTTESKVIYWSPPFVNADTEDLDDDVRCLVDEQLPMPNQGGASNLTIALQNLDGPEKGENPYPSDDMGNFSLNGGYRTYKLWLVTQHSEYGGWQCDAGAPQYPFLQFFLPPGEQFTWPVLVALKVTIIVEIATPRIHSTSVQKPFVPLMTVDPDDPTGTPVNVTAIEPSITADGTLIVFHGDGDVNQDAANIVSYIWNPDGCKGTGWSWPQCVTQVPPDEFPGSDEDFFRRYAFAKNPIREPYNHEYGPDDRLIGTYPWLSKDGSFFVASRVQATEAVHLPLIRCGLYVCGDITGGYIKHVDDAALNPTRLGGAMDWPQSETPMAEGGEAFRLADTGRTTMFGTGLSPGLWDPFTRRREPVPTAETSERLPVLPLFAQRTRQYGEVRFEEADGNYLLYLACNESYESFICYTPEGLPFVCTQFDVHATPDTSGRPTRALCTLDAGAAFPQEVTGDSADLRAAIGVEIGEMGLPLHENVGFKGQGIVMSAQGRITVETAPSPAPAWGNYGTQLTVQAFVKEVRANAIGEWTLVEDPGRFRLKLNLSLAQNFVTAELTLPDGVKQASANWPASAQNLFDPGAGWCHVAMVYDGNTTAVAPPSSNVSRLTLYVNGENVAHFEWSPSSIDEPASPQIYVGPGRDPSPAVVTTSNMSLVMDEVAISRVARTEAEIRRDAYRQPAEDGSVPVPNEILASMPAGLDSQEIEWPGAHPYDDDKVALGAHLFASTLLTKPPANGRKCASCHIPGEAFANEDQIVPNAHLGFPLAFNAPTLRNMAFGTHKLFDGRAASLEDQVTSPIIGVEMGPQPLINVLNRLKNNGTVLTLFGEAYPPGGVAAVTEANLKESLAMYLRTVMSGGSPYDEDVLLRTGEDPPAELEPLEPLSALAQQGRALFFGKARCSGCHGGSNFSDGDFHNIGTVKTTETITGRGGFTGRASENGMLKTPTLRNVSQTGPWFHDGSVDDLGQVIQHYNDANPSSFLGTLDRQLRPLDLDDPDEVNALVAFLESLTGTQATPP